jgi:hypothetical protein
MPAFTSYSIAAGHNNAAGLVVVGLIVPSSHIAFFEPVARPSWNPGITRIRLDAMNYQAGYDSQEWLFQFMTFAHYAYFRTTYCGGGYSGKVTIRTRYQTASYFNANAIASLPLPSQLQSTGQGYQNVPVVMRKIIALP